MAENLAPFISILGEYTFGIGDKLAWGFAYGLVEWSRKAELSADRAGLLVTQNREDALRALGKLAVGSRKIADQINLEDLLQQAEEFEELESGLMRQFWRFFMGMEEGDRPWLMLRIKEAAVWASETMPSFLEPFQEVEASPKALTQKLSHAKAYNNRGNARMAAGDREGAFSDYNRAIELDPNYALAYYNRGFLRYQLGEREGALADYNRAIALEAGNAFAYYNRGIVRYELGDRSGAVDDYSQAIALNPTLTLAYYNRGIARYYLGDKKAALEDYERAIALDSNYPPAYYNRGNVRARLGELEGASADFQKAADLYREQGNEEGYKGALDRLGKLRE
jgi:tetratricopeptide (TPR) repeat protein